MQPMKERKEKEIQIRELYGDDLSILKPLLDLHGVAIEFPHLAVAKVAFCGEDIAGYAIFQMVPHAEPLWVAPLYRGQELTYRLAKEITDFARDAAGSFVCVATSPFTEKICREHLQLKAIDGQVFVGRA
jgi:hypothetical protein